MHHRPASRSLRPIMLSIAAAAGLAAGASALAQQDEPLARYFGFEPMRIIVGDDGFGPVIAADMNGDGRRDIVAANNAKSRIEIHYQRDQMRTPGETEKAMKPNELPPSPWYDREDVSVGHRVAAVTAHDVDGDGKLDLVYAGVMPSELVVMRQVTSGDPAAAQARGGRGRVDGGSFEVFSKRRVNGLSARADGLMIADVLGDEEPELISLVESNVEVFTLGDDGEIGSPVRLGSSGKIVAAWVEDFNGDGMWDILGAAPDDAAPLRLWMQRQDPRVSAKSGLLGAELRFEMPQLNEAEPIRFFDRDAASIGVIERQTRRIVFYDVEHAPVESPGDAVTAAEREVQAEVTSFADSSRADRSVAVTDLDGDGMADLLATNSTANTVDLYRQSSRVGLGAREPFSAFKAPKVIAVGEWAVGGADSSPTPEVFVLSQEEKTVGVSFYDEKTGKLDFPTPLPLTVSGGQPEAMSYVTLDGVGTLAVVISKKRDQTVELHRVGADGSDEVFPIELTGVNRTPQSILAADADQDGRSDLLLFTPGEPMVMVRSKDGDEPGRPSQVMRNEDMPQFGLVQAAGPNNTAVFDIDGDGKQELLIADKNFVRAVVYDGARGWKVVEQITVADRGTELVGLATGTLGGSEVDSAGGTQVLFASDKGNGRVLGFARDADGAWRVTDRMRLMGFPLGPIQVGAFGGDGQPGLLCFGEDGFALVRLAGQRVRLEPFAAYRSDEEGRREHDIEVGDLNGDGYLDIAVLDAGEQMCQIFTFSAARNLHLAMEFEVFESRLFGRGSASEYEPRSAMVADVTGDGRQDLILTVHDRLLIYPQMAR